MLPATASGLSPFLYQDFPEQPGNCRPTGCWAVLACWGPRAAEGLASASQQTEAEHVRVCELTHVKGIEERVVNLNVSRLDNSILRCFHDFDGFIVAP